MLEDKDKYALRGLNLYDISLEKENIFLK